MVCRRLLACMLLLTGLAGCATQPPASSTLGSTLVQTAQVISVRDITVKGNQHAGIGTFAGAILGSLIGNHIGGGNGRTVAGIGGAIVGSSAGHQIGQAASTTTTTAVTVRLDNGDVRTYHVTPDEMFRVGDHVQAVTNNGITTLTH